MASQTAKPGDARRPIRQTSSARSPRYILFALALSYAAGVEATGYDRIAPILAANCIVCHSGTTAAAGLKLDSYDNVLKGGTRGAVVKPGDAANSELIRRVRGSSEPRMPMTGPPYLTDSDIAALESWVAGGLQQGAPSTAAPAGDVQPPRQTQGDAITYRNVAPIFARRCAKCHTDNGAMGQPPEGYRLTSHADTVAAHDRVRVIPGNPAASRVCPSTGLPTLTITRSG